jgi:hypothetical protein
MYAPAAAASSTSATHVLTASTAAIAAVVWGICDCAGQLLASVAVAPAEHQQE